MNWAARFRIGQYIRGSLWILPLLGGVTGAVLGSIDVLVDESLHLPPSLTYSATTAGTVLASIVGAAAALTGFVVTVTALVVQMATSTFSARYMRLWYRDQVLKALLALLIGTLSFSFALLRHVEANFVPDLGTTIAGALLLAGLLLFVIFLDRFLHRLRPVAVASLVSGYVRRDFRSIGRALAAAPDVYWGLAEPDGDPALVVRSQNRGGDSSHRRSRTRPLGPGASLARGGPALDGGLRAHRREAARDLHRERNQPSRGAGAPQVGGARGRAHDRAGPRICHPDHGRHRRQGAVARDKRPDDRGAGARPPQRRAADDRHDRPVGGPVEPRRPRFGGTGDPGPPLGGLPGAGDHRDPRVRIGLHPGDAEDARMLLELHDEVPPAHRAAVEEELVRLDATVARSFAATIDIDRASVADAQGIGGRVSPGRSHLASSASGPGHPEASDADR